MSEPGMPTADRCRCGHRYNEHEPGCALCMCPSFIDPRTPPAPTVRVAEMVRGLVRAAEFKEQEDGGKVWDDEVRTALEESRRRGWGKNQIGPLEEVDGPIVTIVSRGAPSSGIEAPGSVPPREASEDAKESPARFLCVNMLGCEKDPKCEHRCLKYEPAPTPGSTTGGDDEEAYEDASEEELIETAHNCDSEAVGELFRRECLKTAQLRTDLAAALKREGEARAAKEGAAYEAVCLRHDIAAAQRYAREARAELGQVELIKVELELAAREARERATRLETAMEFAKSALVSVRDGSTYTARDGSKTAHHRLLGEAALADIEHLLAPVPTAEAAASKEATCPTK